MRRVRFALQARMGQVLRGQDMHTCLSVILIPTTKPRQSGQESTGRVLAITRCSILARHGQGNQVAGLQQRSVEGFETTLERQECRRSWPEIQQFNQDLLPDRQVAPGICRNRKIDNCECPERHHEQKGTPLICRPLISSLLHSRIRYMTGIGICSEFASRHEDDEIYNPSIVAVSLPANRHIPVQAFFDRPNIRLN